MTQSPELTIPAIREQINASVGTMQDGMIAIGQELEGQAVANGNIVVERLAVPTKLNFGEFTQKTTFNQELRADMRVGGEPGSGGVDELVIGIKKPDGGSQIVEIGRNLKTQRPTNTNAGRQAYGNPESDLMVIVHDGKAASSYFVSKADISHPIRRGRRFRFGSERSLGRVFEGGVVEKVVGFSELVRPSQP